jgi:cobalt-zinc-cadmium efflux system membrane fusion protein
MNRWMLLWVFALASCQRSPSPDEQGHAHEPESPTLAYTLYSDKTELFIEFKPLVVGQSTRFAAHFTKLSDSFTALTEASITVSLIVDGKGIRSAVDKPSSPGIFRLALKPTTVGTGNLVFDVKTPEYTDRLTIKAVVVYADQKSADALKIEEPEGGSISFLKEQAWKIEFANQRIEPQTFYDVIKTSGQLNAKATDEQVISARSSGAVKWNEKIAPGASVVQGQELFVLTSGNLAQGNIESQYREAKSNFEKAEADYIRVQPLLADKIVSQKDYAEIKNKYEQTKIEYETLGRNYSQGGQTVQSPMAGFVKQLTVRSGEYVQAGQPLAIITKDNSLQLEAVVPIRYANLLPLITEASFKTPGTGRVYQTTDMNGRIMSYGKAVGEASSLLPIYFSINNDGSLIPGQVVEVYLRSRPIPSALVIPVNALIEEQGNFYVYVQTEGESFQKRLIKTGANDGISVQILSGVEPGERVVTKGAHMIKLATQSGSAPAHGHEH